MPESITFTVFIFNRCFRKKLYEGFLLCLTYSFRNSPPEGSTGQHDMASLNGGNPYLLSIF